MDFKHFLSFTIKVTIIEITIIIKNKINLENKFSLKFKFKFEFKLFFFFCCINKIKHKNNHQKENIKTLDLLTMQIQKENMTIIPPENNIAINKKTHWLKEYLIQKIIIKIPIQAFKNKIEIGLFLVI